MAQGLLWVTKTQTSSQLSCSARDEDKRIRRHVQKTRRKLVKMRENSHGLRACDSKDPVNSGLSPDQFPGRRNGNVLQPRIDGTPKANSEVIPSPGNGLILSHSTYNVLGLEPSEGRGLDFFASRTAREWAGWQDASFWNILALQLCRGSRIVTHALISLAAIHESFQANLGNMERLKLREYACLQSDKAIVATRNQKLNYFEALVSCIIIICLQNLQENKGPSVLLFCSGEKMLAQYEFESRANGDSRGVSRYEDSLVTSCLKPLFDHLRTRFCNRVDAAATFAVAVCHRRKQLLGSDSRVYKVPKTFSTLRDARESLLSVLHWGLDHICAEDLAEKRLVSRGQFQRLCEAWDIATEGITLQPRAREKCADAKTKRLLQIGCDFGRVLILTYGSDEETCYDLFLPTFRKIIQTLEEICLLNSDSLTDDVSLGIDGGIITILTFVGQKCRDPKVRRRAVDLLDRGRRIEGDLHGRVGGLLLQQLIEMEESNLIVHSCSDVPESSRRRVVMARQFYARQKVHLLLDRFPYSQNESEALDGRWIDVSEIHKAVPGSPAIADELPDVISAPGYTKILQDRGKGQYHRTEVCGYIFMIPRI